MADKSYLQAWIAISTPLITNRSRKIRSLCPNPLIRRSCSPASKRPVISATAQPRSETTPTGTPSTDGSPPGGSSTPPVDPLGINGTAIFYFAILAAQLLPFFKATSGVAGDLVYFTVTAMSCIVIGVRRAPLEPPALSTDLSSRQALAAPFTASLFLFGSYLLLKYTSIDISLILNCLTSLGGALCVKETLDPIFHSLIGLFNLSDKELIPEGDAPPDGDEKNIRPPFLVSNLLSSGAAIATTAAYWLKLQPSFVISNAIAVSLATRVLSIVRPSSFLVAAGLLAGLFFYDIFWVFGSEVMVSVATQIDIPGKLLFPRDIAQTATSSVKYPYAILGLGDVCVPGIFISLAQTLDMKLAPEIPQAKQPYFAAAISAYVAALLTCFFVNFQTGAAQPALLYLVPALIGSSLGVAALRGELKEVVTFSTEASEGAESEVLNAEETNTNTR